jgi:hypothetical protein
VETNIGGGGMSKRIMRWFGDFRNEIVLEMVREHIPVMRREKDMKLCTSGNEYRRRRHE